MIFLSRTRPTVRGFLRTELPVTRSSDWRGGRALGKKTTLSLAAENLSDEDYRVHGSGLNGPGETSFFPFLTAFKDNLTPESPPKLSFLAFEILSATFFQYASVSKRLWLRFPPFLLSFRFFYP